MHRLEGRPSAVAVVCVALAAAALTAAPARADGVLFTFDGGGDGTSWSDPLNWDRDALPGLLDLVAIPGGFEAVADMQNLSVQPSLRAVTVEPGGSLLVEQGPPDFPLQIFEQLTVGGSLLVAGELLLNRSVGEVVIEGTLELRHGAVVDVHLGFEPSRWFGPGLVILGSDSMFEPPPRVELLDVESPFTDGEFILETTVLAGVTGDAGWIGVSSDSPAGAQYSILNFGAIGTDTGTIAVGGGPEIATFTNGGVIEVQGGGVHVEAEHTVNLDAMFLDGSGAITIDDPLAAAPMSFLNEGSLFVGAGTTLITTPPLESTGNIGGDGQIQGSLVNRGLLSAGTSPGQLDVTGDVTLDATGTLVTEIEGTTPGLTFDVITAGGTLTLGGTLAVLRGVFQPAADDVFTVASGAARAGTFAAVTGNDLGDGTFLLPEYTPTGVNLVVGEPATVTIEITETITVADDVVVIPPVAIHVEEIIGVTDDASVIPPVSITITETITVADEPSVNAPVTIAITETVQVSDGVAVLPPVTIAVTEAIHVSDEVAVLPPVTIAITEAIVVVDEPTLNPPLTIAVVETIGVSDDVVVAGPMLIAVHETIAVSDTVVVSDDEPGSISVSKTASPEQLPAPGGDVTYTVVVTNTSDDDAVTITSITDDAFDISGECASLPATLAPDDTFTCVFTRTLSGVAGETHTNTVTVAGIDDDGVPVGGSHAATVTFVRARGGTGGPPPEPGPPDEPGPPSDGGGGPPDDRGPPPGRGRPGDP